jgi:putative holliday junction resolvase
MMRYIGIDYGTKKIGIAVSDEEGRMAFPHSVVPNDAGFRGRILSLIREHDAPVVLGESLAHDGSENNIASAVKNLATFLGEKGVVVYFEPERYTSREAERIQGRTPLTDASAAALILNSFLTRHRS